MNHANKPLNCGKKNHGKKSRGKKLFFVPLALVLCLLTACGGGGGANTPQVNEGTDGENRLSIVTTIFPAYDWTRQILGDRDAELTLLLDSGVDLHSYQPSVADLVKTSSCDLLIYVGGNSDSWIEDALATAVNRDMLVVNLLDTLETASAGAVKEEEALEGMEPDRDDAHGDDANAPEYDEHVWLSLRNAETLCETIAARLGELDSANRDQYAANAAAYMEKLDALDREYARTVEAAPRRTLLFGDRFPFRYLADDYGLTCYAAFPGCSAETEASFKTIVFLAGKTDELGLSTVLTTETGDGRIARTIVENTAKQSARILTMDSMQSVTARELQDGVTYLDIMTHNLNTLRQALR